MIVRKEDDAASGKQGILFMISDDGIGIAGNTEDDKETFTKSKAQAQNKDSLQEIISKNTHLGIKGMKNRQEYNTLKHISEYMMILELSEPNGPEGAEWKNYTNTPRPAEKSRPDDGKSKKVEASMNSVFGKPFLMEDDWRIE